ncbi:MAG: UDP-N-acetylmuramate:L-alanyl-gamma-D-glutamyl-meso-diaminopimelate ligase [Pseudomonadota bacterium]
MHLHILGICGTFMGSLALLARELGHSVSGSDQNVYPPMSTQLEEQGIELHSGYDAKYLKETPDMVIVGNAMTRGNLAVEALLESNIPYCSGPEWLRANVLQGRWVLAVAGTHGKTTTTSMLAHILDQAGLEPGFLIGGIAQDFGISARLGSGRYFVIEADEYDSAFFDKRSKFVHYLPRTLILNNLEFDHADIFADLAAIQTQFHHLVRTVPASGRIFAPDQHSALTAVLDRGCWSECAYMGAYGSDARWQRHDGEPLQLLDKETGQQAPLVWEHAGEHNAANALAAAAAADHAGVSLSESVKALHSFQGVKRRMEKLYDANGVCVYDDFAHHPTAIRLTLEGLRKNKPSARIIAVIEPRSNTMRMGSHAQALHSSVAAADWVIWFTPAGLDWNPEFLRQDVANRVDLISSTADIAALIAEQLQSNDEVVIMSNGGFEGIHAKLVEKIRLANV